MSLWLTAASQTDMVPWGGDDVVNLRDLSFFASQWLQSPGW